MNRVQEENYLFLVRFNRLIYWLVKIYKFSLSIGYSENSQNL